MLQGTGMLRRTSKKNVTADSTQDRDTFYRLTYPVYCDYFKATLTNEASGIDCMERAVALVFTWMGRGSGRVRSASLTDHSRVREAIWTLYTATARKREYERSFGELTRFVGGSPVAASKFLHFLRPEIGRAHV